MLAPSLADFLRSRRTDCNARFAAARHRWPRLDAGDFSLFLRDQLSPLADALAATAPAHGPIVLERAYDLGLQLVAEKLAGPSALDADINRLWSDVFPSLAALIATSPRRLLGSLCNAAHQLSTTPDTRSDNWRARLVTLAPRCAHADELLILVQLLAWRAGLAHYRSSALSVADALPADLALEALDAPLGLDWPQVRDAHRQNAWFGYDSHHRPIDAAILHRRFGSFRGFGGPFLRPPLVTRCGSQLAVLSGDEAWILLADAFGATLHRASPEDVAASEPPTISRAHSACLPPGHTPSSTVTLGAVATYALTSAQSHSVWVGPLIAS
jgi:hypothetical protein